MLGNSYVAINATDSAVTAFQYAVRSNPSDQERLETLVGLANAWAVMGEPHRVLPVLAQAQKIARSEKQISEILLLAARSYRRMGIPEKGAAFLRANVLAISEPRLKAMLKVELGRCYRDAGSLIEAYETMTRALVDLPAGESVYDVACEMAEICLMIDKPGEAVAYAEGVANSPSADSQRLRARKILASAYAAKKDYAQAALMLAEPTSQQPGAQE